jgi:hypothetical protein
MVATPIENPDESPCWGCGPQHPRGLHLAFLREGDAVTCTYTPKEDEIGWPDVFHTGLHFTALFETAYWAALDITGKVHVASGTHQFHQDRLPRVGKPFKVTARIAQREPMLRIRAESVTTEGKPCAWLDVGMTPASRAQVTRAGIVLPQYLLDEMAP